MLFGLSVTDLIIPAIVLVALLANAVRTRRIRAAIEVANDRPVHPLRRLHTPGHEATRRDHRTPTASDIDRSATRIVRAPPAVGRPSAPRTRRMNLRRAMINQVILARPRR